MPTVCLYFQLHQPYRLRRYSVFDTDRHYFDDFKNAELLRQLATRCYIPTTQMLLDLVRDHVGDFRFTLSVSGVLLEQFETHVPEVITGLKKLADTGCVELLNETYYHSLSFLYSRDEFRQQVDMHRQKIKQLFGQEARVFRNTELIYSNDVAESVGHMGFDACLAAGVESVLLGRRGGAVYAPPGQEQFKLLLNNGRLSNDIALRFSDKNWPGFPFTAKQFAAEMAGVGGEESSCNLFMNFETFGDYHTQETGIFQFLRELPTQALSHPKMRFATPSQVIQTMPMSGNIDTPHLTSWSAEHDLSTWLGNAMQSNALHELYKLESKLKQHGDRTLLTDWRKLGTSDHFYYMCTKPWATAGPHQTNPYESPYDSYINFMNVLDNIQSRLRG